MSSENLASESSNDTLQLPESDDPLECALAYRELGFHPVFTEGKVPKYLTGWQQLELDENDIKAWYARFRGKRPNVGISPRQWRGQWLMAVDVDSQERLEYLESKLGPLPPTLTGRSARGERRFYLVPPEISADDLKNRTYLRLPGELKPSGKVEGIDVKTVGGQVVVYPSIHETGIQYSWTDNRVPVTIPHAWLTIILGPAEEGEKRAPAESKAYKAVEKYTPQTIHKYTRDFNRAKSYFESALHNQCYAIANSGEGTRNDALNSGAFQVFSLMYGLKLEEQALIAARGELLRAGVSAGLQEFEVRKTIDSAHKGGRLKAKAPHLREVITTEVPQAYDLEVLVGSAPAPKLLPEEGGQWQLGKPKDDGLHRYRGSAVVDADNIAHVLRTAPEFCGGPFFNEFGGNIVWKQLPECLRTVRQGVSSNDYQDTDAVALGGALTRLTRYEWEGPVKGKDVVHDGVVRASGQQTCNTLVDHIGTLPEWDGVQRVDTMFRDLFGSEGGEAETKIARAFMSLVFARAMSADPIEVDGTLLLYGPEGCGKDTFFRELFGREWYSEPRGKLTDKDVLSELSRTWISHDAEMASLRATVQRGDQNDPLASVKAILTAPHDDIRLPYARTSVRLRRRAIIVFSTNSKELLQHNEGGRRFWPVTVKRLDRERLRECRLQLLAEGLALFRAGEPWWLSATDEGLNEARESFRAEEHPWAPLVWAAVGELAHRYGTELRVCTNEIYGAIERDPSKRGRDGKRIIGVILRDGGWSRHTHQVACRPGVLSKSTYFKGEGESR